MVQKNAWVQIHKIILMPKERAATLPGDTKKVPLEMWVKGYLLADANIDDEVSVKTVTGRIESGTLVKENPAYLHTYGKFVPELLEIDRIVKTAMYGGDEFE